MIEITNRQRALNFLYTMGALFAGEHGDTHAGAVQKEAMLSLTTGWWY